jgi:NADPH-dependent 2,4-dienoyl-CoA reductase/sulfur reductase-like enzyme
VSYDVCVVGAGPAGLAAAAVAARGGAAVVLVDAGPRPGGQFWRHRAAGLAADADLHHDIGLFTRLLTRLGPAKARYLPGHQVWTVSAGPAGGTVRAIGPGQAAVTIDAQYLVLAPGAYDRQIPFPGWDLPGVMTAGGVQALLKGHGVLAGPRVLVAGTGPFLLPVAAGLATRGGTVTGVHEASHPAGWLRRPAGWPGGAGKLAEAAGYARTLARHRVPVRHRSALVAAEGRDHVEAAVVAPVGRDGRARLAAARRIETDVIAAGWGFTPQLELFLTVGCASGLDTDGSLIVLADDDQFTSQPRVLAAGEATGVGGATLAAVEGALAGSAAAAAAGHRPLRPDVLGRLRQRRARLRGFAQAMHRVYPVPAGWPDIVAGSTVVCRCEEVTAAQLREATELGAADVRAAKLLSRAGMGWCQGRVCGYAAACLVARWTGSSYDPAGLAARPLAAPLPLRTLAGEQTAAGPGVSRSENQN